MINVDDNRIVVGGRMSDLSKEIHEVLCELYRRARENDVGDQFDKAMIMAVLIAGVEHPSFNLAFEMKKGSKKYREASDKLVDELQKAMNMARKFYEDPLKEEKKQ